MNITFSADGMTIALKHTLYSWSGPSACYWVCTFPAGLGLSSVSPDLHEGPRGRTVWEGHVDESRGEVFPHIVCLSRVKQTCV